MHSAIPSPRNKPKFRGSFHGIAFAVALGAGAVLVTIPHSAAATWTAAIYALSLVAMFGISALYHIPTWSASRRQWLKRLDHSAIFILISGTVTPIATLALGHAGGNLLQAVWTGAILGVLQSLFWVKAPKVVTAGLYLALGWMAAPYFPEIIQALGMCGLWLILGGGILYSVGAIIYALRWPDPVPATFGYHEIFHLFVIAASICHFIVILTIMQGPLAR